MNLLFRILTCYTFLLINHVTFAQEITEINTPHATSLRGLSVVDDQTVWVSGSNGTVGRSVDGGTTWKWIQVKGFEKNDFRDIEAFDKQTALIMSVAEPAYILRTIDGGENWQVVLKDTSKGMFLDALMFWNINSGMVIGDPIRNRFYIARTFDGGRTWQTLPENKLPKAESGEAIFAASGTNIGRMNKSEAVYVTGGSVHKFYKKDKHVLLPYQDTSASSGPNSIAIKNKRNLMIVGGDYLKKDERLGNCFISKDGGVTWQEPVIPPFGYRSCVAFIKGKKWIACGINGVDITNDNGDTWLNFSSSGFHVVQKAKKGNAVFLAGKNKVGKFK